MRRQVLFAGVAATALAAGLGFVVVNSLTDTDSEPDAHTDTQHRPAAPTAAPTAGGRDRAATSAPSDRPARAEAAPASQADVALTAELTPADVGREVTLERLDGGTWVEVATRPENAHGFADFTAPAEVEGEVATYRVSAEAGGDDDDVTSPRVRADLGRAGLQRRVLGHRAVGRLGSTGPGAQP